MPDDLRAGWLDELERTTIDDDYKNAYGRWKQSLTGASIAEVTLTSRQLVGHGKPEISAGLAEVRWLGARNPLTVLPAVSSLKALRRDGTPSRTAEPFLGFGNPLLTGPDGTDKRAWARQTCPAPGAFERTRVALTGLQGKLASLFRGGLANVDDVRRQAPLPETADELCAVARALGVSAPDASVNLGERATEARVKKLSADGTLVRARVVHFATHGLIAAEIAQLSAAKAEPALMLTPPVEASENDDGLLTASEVAGLKLDADWVILSACNTAGPAGGGQDGKGEGVGGDALSGLARAFFYAGARALLVSHWYVDSEATVALVTKAFDVLKAEPGLGRAEALRRAMASLIGSGGRLSHPANWAPFVVVAQANAITILPSVASLGALRGPWRKTAPAPEPYIGFGDPILDGHSNCPEPVKVASCPGEAPAAASGPASSTSPSASAPGGLVKTALAWGAAAIEKISRRGVADVAEIRRQCPLPETADEMRCVAKSLGAAATQVITGAAATEPAVRDRKPPFAALDRFRVIHFATHGLLAGEAEAILKAGAEPGLILTPPATGTAPVTGDNDGLLTASEIAQLKLNADWVILSACNTAGPAAGGQDGSDKTGADSLSGLARAFFYAGARALLVSHWYVSSEASVKLVTRAFAELRADDKLGRAEALRRAMRHLIEQDAPYAAHRSYWAPFNVVGEGGR